jgi:2-methylcitrate dehydratase PrpD
VNIQYILAVTLLDGTLTFEASHSFERMRDPAVLAMKERVRLVGDRGLMVPDAPRSARVEVLLRDGQTLSRFVRHPPGFKENPLDERRINDKTRRLVAPVLGEQRAEALIQTVSRLDTGTSVRELRSLLAAG